MNTTQTKILVILSLITWLYGCSSMQTFSTAARPGDTVTLPIGAYYDLDRTDISASIQPCAGTWPSGIDQTIGGCIQPMGAPIVYNQGDTRIRAVANMRPDSLSKLVIERETSGDGFGTPGRLLENATLDKDKEYIQTFIMLDLPNSLTTSLASIALTSTAGHTFKPIAVEVLPGTGYSNTIKSYGFPPLETYLPDFERAPHYTISFTKDTGTETPHAIQVDFIHNLTDQDVVGNGGTGVAFATNPRGDIKNIAWSDDGTSMRVILTPAWIRARNPGEGEAMSLMTHFKFYIAGGVTGLQLAPPSTEIPNGFLAFDIDGNEITSGININIE